MFYTSYYVKLWSLKFVTFQVNHPVHYCNLTSSCALSFFAPSHQDSFGGGYPPSAWHMTSSSFPEETNKGLARIASEVGFTRERKLRLIRSLRVQNISYKVIKKCPQGSFFPSLILTNCPRDCIPLANGFLLLFTFKALVFGPCLLP